MEFQKIDQKIYGGIDLIHISDHFYQTVEYSQLILNENSVNALESSECENYGYNGWILGHLKFQTLRNLMYSNMSLLEMERLIFFWGISMYARALRSFRDIDFIIINIEPNTSEEFTKRIEKLFLDKSTKIFFMDGGLKDSIYWDAEWDKNDKPIMNILNIKSHNDLVLNPRNHMYYQGIKMVNFEFEIIRKLIRNVSADHVDYVMFNSSNNNLIKFDTPLVGRDGS